MNDDQQSSSAGSPSSGPLAALAQQVQSISSGNSLADVIKDAVSGVPGVGNQFSSLMDDFIPESREKRVREFIVQFASDLNALQGRLRTDYVKTDEYAYLFTKVMQNVTRDYQKSKLDSYRNLLTNTLKYDVDAAVTESMLKRIEDLTALHLEVLTCFHSDRRNEAILGPADYSGWSSGSLGQTMKTLLPHLRESQIEDAIFDLDAAGITNGVRGSMRTMMTSHGARQLETRLTDYGRTFVEFISKP